MVEAIIEKNKTNNKSRIVAGYCWNWIKEGKNNTNYFRCQCDCGRISEISTKHFFNDNQLTCGRFHKKYENSENNA